MAACCSATRCLNASMADSRLSPAPTVPFSMTAGSFRISSNFARCAESSGAVSVV